MSSKSEQSSSSEEKPKEVPELQVTDTSDAKPKAEEDIGEVVVDTSKTYPNTPESLASVDGPTTKKELFAWYMYDWANSVYFNTVLQSFLPGYLTLVATNAENEEHKIPFLGASISGSSYYTSVVPISVLIQLIAFVLLGTTGDFGGMRKYLLIACSVVGSVSTMLFIFVVADTFWLGGLLLVISNVALGLSIIYYNAFLPVLVDNHPDVLASKGEPNADEINVQVSQKISSIGFILGYAAGVVLLLLNIGVALLGSDACKKWCVDCPTLAVWESDFAYNIQNATMADDLPEDRLRARPGLMPPCSNTTTNADGLVLCYARPVYDCGPLGCIARNNTECFPDRRGTCADDTFTCREGDTAKNATCAYQCVDPACEYFECNYKQCQHNYDPSTCDPNNWVFRINLFSGGLWWFGFAFFTYFWMKKRPGPDLPPGKHYVTESLKRIYHTFKKVRKLPNTFRFLLAYWMYSDGFATISFGAIVVAVTEPLFFTSLDLGVLLLITNVTALLGNIFYLFVAKGLVRLHKRRLRKKGWSEEKIKDGLDTAWTGIVIIYINLFFVCLLPIWAMEGVGMNNKWEMFFAASLYGFQVGSIQAFSRSLLEHMTPEGCESEFYSLYELSDKGTSWSGPIVFSVVNEATGSPRNAIASIMIIGSVDGFVMQILVEVFIFLGMIILAFVRPKQGGIDAANFHLTHDIAVEEEEEKIKEASRAASRRTTSVRDIILGAAADAAPGHRLSRRDSVLRHRSSHGSRRESMLEAGTKRSSRRQTADGASQPLVDDDKRKRRKGSHGGRKKSRETSKRHRSHAKESDAEVEEDKLSVAEIETSEE